MIAPTIDHTHVTSQMKPSIGICVFFSREPQQIAIRTLDHVLAAAPKDSVIDMVINGNSGLAEQMAQYCQSAAWSGRAVCVRVWTIELGDKANAWNQYFHHIWSGESLALFLDGYVMPYPDAITMLVRDVMNNYSALGGTGVPSVGRTAKQTVQQMERSGGFQGNLCCIKGSTIEQIKAEGVRIPVGLYRTDSFIGALLYFGVSRKADDWDLSRIAIVPAASWTTAPKRWWHLPDLLSQFKRLVRQSRGVMENLAIKEHLTERHMSPASLPSHAYTLIHQWAVRNPFRCVATLIRHPLALTWLTRAATLNPAIAIHPVLLSA